MFLCLELMNLIQIFDAFSNSLPEESQRLRQVSFWKIASDSPVRKWKVGDSTPDAILHLRIGLAPSYSRPDIEFANEILLTAERDPRVNVAFFDVSELKGQEDLALYLPGVKNAFQTPIVGVWKKGSSTGFAFGKAGRELALDKIKSLGLDTQL